MWEIAGIAAVILLIYFGITRYIDQKFKNIEDTLMHNFDKLHEDVEKLPGRTRLSLWATQDGMDKNK